MNAEKEFKLIWNNRKAILIIHGLTGGPFELKHIAREFHRNGYDVYCPVLPGHVQSLSELKKTKWQDWKTYLEAYLRMIIRQGYDDVYIAGLCMGATLGLAIAVSMEFEIKGIATWSIFTKPNGWSLPWYRFLLPLVMYTPMRYVYDVKERYPYGIKNSILRKKVCYLMLNGTSVYDRMPTVSLLELKKLTKFLMNNIKKINSPVLMIHSEFDDISDIKNSEDVFDHLQVTNKHFVRLYNSYHMITIDNERDLVANETIKFFENI